MWYHNGLRLELNDSIPWNKEKLVDNALKKEKIVLIKLKENPRVLNLDRNR